MAELQNTTLLEIRKFVAPEYIFGVDARLLASQYCKKLGVRKLFFATDKQLMHTQWCREIEAQLITEGIEYVLFSAISPNPRDYEVMEGARVFIENKCNMLLALGGGSVIDCAKGIGIVATNGQEISLFEGIDKILKPMPPLISIPTTGGTSADVSQFAIINNSNERYKMSIISKALVSDVALIDPVTLTTMDPLLTACTGMDALSHAFEAMVSNASSPMTDLYALEAIRIIEAELLNTIIHPNDINARAKIMLASLYAGLAFSNASLGCVHSLAHSLGGYLDLPHGECNAILLSHVVDYNYKTARLRYNKIAETMNIDTNNMNDNQIKNALQFHLLDLNKSLGINATFSQRGVTSDLIPTLAQKAIMDPCNATNPRPPMKGDFETIYHESM
jgi:alcohol dehydrogenase